MSGPRIALIHATPVAVEPIRAAIAALWPNADPVNILDESLSVDRARTVDLTEAIITRIRRLADYAVLLGAQGILFTCSAFGPAIEEAAQSVAIPVLKPNEAMFEEARRLGPRIGMVVTFPPAISTMEQEFSEDSDGKTASLKTVICADAMKALRQGDAEAHNQLVAESCAQFTDVDAIMLAHFSTARALQAARVATKVPILSSPEAAVKKMRRLLA